MGPNTQRAGSQVFDPDGTGFQFVAYDTRGYTQDPRGDPYLSYNEMLAVMSRSLRDSIKAVIPAVLQRKSRFTRIRRSKKKKFLALWTPSIDPHGGRAGSGNQVFGLDGSCLTAETRKRTSTR